MLDLPLERLLEALAEGPVESESAPDERALEGLHLLSGAAPQRKKESAFQIMVGSISIVVGVHAAARLT